MKFVEFGCLPIWRNNMTIKNNSMYQPESVVIELLEFPDEDSIAYRGALHYILSDTATICILLDIFSDNIKECLAVICGTVRYQYDNIGSEFLLTKLDNTYERYDINSVLFDEENKELH